MIISLRETVRRALRPDAVFAHYKIAFLGERELRAKDCGACGERTRETLSVNAESGRWVCHRCGAKGDLFGLVAAYEGLDVVREFRRVLQIAGSIAGVDTTGAEATTRPRVEYASASAEHRRRDEAERERAIDGVAPRWNRLLPRSTDGEVYLRERGLDSAFLIERDLVRFSVAGDVVVRLFDLGNFRAVNLVTRRRIVAARSPKVVGLKGCPTKGSLVNRVDEIDEGRDVAVLTEGVMDSLAAAAFWPTCVVVGAHGAGRLADVARAAAPRLAGVRGWLLLAPHADGGTGERAMAAAAKQAFDSGLALDIDIHLVDVLPAKDVADALRDRSLRWTWPT